jgi:peptidoglycan/LPS O-acetylase OafA/YrhL
MAQATPPSHGGLKGARWIARILGLIVVLLFLWFLAYAGAKVIPSLAWGDPQGVPLFAVLVAAVSGVLVAWRWELLGGLLALLGAAAIVVLVYAGGGTGSILGAILLALPLAVAGILYLGAHVRARRLRADKT